MKDMAYFSDNVMYAIEVEYEDGGRMWERSVGYNLKDTLDEIKNRDGESLSDIDYCTHQPDEWCRKVLNIAHINFFKNMDWCKGNKLGSLDDVIRFVVSNGLV